MSSNSSPNSDMSNMEETADPSPLHSAVKLGDLIRTHVNKQQQASMSEPKTKDKTSNKGLVESLVNPSGMTPGLMEGMAVTLLAAGIMTPVRSRTLQSSSPHMRFFVDLLTSSTLVIGSLMSGMYVGSLVGSTVYLHQLAAVPTEGASPIADAVCHSALAQQQQLSLQGMAEGPSARLHYLGWSDPRRSATDAFREALRKCQDRSAYQAQSTSDATAEGSTGSTTYR
jgi:hypothetical protein